MTTRRIFLGLLACLPLAWQVKLTGSARARTVRADESAVFTAFLDVNDRHPELFGEAILPRDDDGLGFSLRDLHRLRGRYVRITIEALPDDPSSPRLWSLDRP